MRALEEFQQHKIVHAQIVGGDGVSCGKCPKDARNWREKLLSEVKLDPSRTHFLGRIPRQHDINVLQVPAAHVYLTYPLVLSWSLLEAMACGTHTVSSDTEPVREVVEDGANGMLVPFFGADAIVDQLALALDPGVQRITYASALGTQRHAARAAQVCGVMAD